MNLQITARNMELTDAIRAEINEKSDSLNQYYDRIMRLRVVVEVPHRHSKEGKFFNVIIEVRLPGGEFVVKREPNEDIYVAIRDAFDAARRRLDDFAKKQRGDIKYHEETPTGRISSLFPDKGYGFLTTPDGLDIYFHENSVLKKKFSHLKVGMEVRYTKEIGEKGPQASSVTVLG